MNYTLKQEVLATIKYDQRHMKLCHDAKYYTFLKCQISQQMKYDLLLLVYALNNNIKPQSTSILGGNSDAI